MKIANTAQTLRTATDSTVVQYDQRRAFFPEESEGEVRHTAVGYLSMVACIDYMTAAELLADALARRAANKQSQETSK